MFVQRGLGTGVVPPFSTSRGAFNPAPTTQRGLRRKVDHSKVQKVRNRDQKRGAK